THARDAGHRSDVFRAALGVEDEVRHDEVALLERRLGDELAQTRATPEPAGSDPHGVFPSRVSSARTIAAKSRPSASCTCSKPAARAAAAVVGPIAMVRAPSGARARASRPFSAEGLA